MNRALLCGLSLGALCSCIEWGNEFDKLDAGGLPSRNGGGSGATGGGAGGVGGGSAGGGVDAGNDAGAVDGGPLDAGLADAGRGDAGDAGPGDAGCVARYCKLTEYLGGGAMRALAFDPDGGPLLFVSANPPAIVTLVGAVWVEQDLPLPKNSIEPLKSLDGVSVTSSADYWAVDPYQISHVIDGVSVAAAGRCGFSASPQHDWNGVKALSADEVIVYGVNLALCRWTRDAGFEAIVPQIASSSFKVGDVFPDGQLWLGDDEGNVRSLAQLAQPTFSGLIGSNSAPVAVDFLRNFDGTVWAASGFGFPTALRPDAGWQVEPMPAPGVWAVFQRSATDLWAVADYSKVFHFNGTTWTQESLPGLPPNINLYLVEARGDLLLLAGQTNASLTGYAALYRLRP